MLNAPENSDIAYRYAVWRMLMCSL